MSEVPSSKLSVSRLVGLGLAARFLIDTSVQMFFPFLPLFAQGLGISAVAMGRLVSVRSIMGLFAPAISGQTERQGYRRLLRLGLFAAGVGYILLGVSQQLWVAVFAMVLAGLGSFSFIPILQAYLSVYLPYDRRARGLGTVELGWALSGIFGLALIGELIARTSWRVPLIGVGVALIMMGFVYMILPPAQRSPHLEQQQDSRPRSTQLRSYINLGHTQRSAWTALLVNGTVMLAAMHTFISYGSWLADGFGLGAAELGRVALLLGVADFVGATLVTLTSDRFGKQRTFILASAAGVVGFIALPWLGGLTLVSAVVGLIITRLTFEISLVSLISLLSEQVPDQRSKVMALATTSALIGTSISGFTGPWAYARFGLPGLALPSAVFMLLSCLLLLFFVRE